MYSRVWNKVHGQHLIMNINIQAKSTLDAKKMGNGYLQLHVLMTKKLFYTLENGYIAKSQRYIASPPKKSILFWYFYNTRQICFLILVLCYDRMFPCTSGPRPCWDVLCWQHTDHCSPQQYLGVRCYYSLHRTTPLCFLCSPKAEFVLSSQ